MASDFCRNQPYGKGQRHGFPGTAGFRETLGPVLCLAPTRPGSASFNPLLEVRRGINEVRDVQNIVDITAVPSGP
jgi:type IV secretion system protein VirD4